MENESAYYQSLETIVKRYIPEDDPAHHELRAQVLTENIKEAPWGASELKSYQNYVKSLHTSQERLEEARRGYEQNTKEMSLRYPNDQSSEIMQNSFSLWKNILAEAENKVVYFKRLVDAEIRRLQDLVMKLAQDYSLVKNSSSFKEKRDFLAQELVAMFGQKIRNDIRSDSYYGDSFDTLVEKLTKRSVPIEVICQAIERHSKYIRERERAAEIFVEQVKADFADQLEKGIAAKWLVGVDIEKIKKRVEKVRPHVIDRLHNPFSTKQAHYETSGVVGLYSEQLVEIDAPRLRKSIIHELLHEAAGNSMNFVTSSTVQENGLSPDSKTSFTFIERQKNGLSLYDKDAPQVMRFAWLDEAVTEWLALRLSGFNNGLTDSSDTYKGSNLYVEERRELDRLFALGLEEELLFRAYFENLAHEGGSLIQKSEYFLRLVRRVGELKDNPEAFSQLDNHFTLQAIIKKFRTFEVVERNVANKNYDVDAPSGTFLCDLVVKFGEEKNTATQIMTVSLWPRESTSSAERLSKITKQLDKLVKQYQGLFTYQMSEYRIVGKDDFVLP